MKPIAALAPASLVLLSLPKAPDSPVQMVRAAASTIEPDQRVSFQGQRSATTVRYMIWPMMPIIPYTPLISSAVLPVKPTVS